MDTDGDEQTDDKMVSFSNKILDLKNERVSLSMNVSVSSHGSVNSDHCQHHDEYFFSLEFVAFVESKLILACRKFHQKIVIRSS